MKACSKMKLPHRNDMYIQKLWKERFWQFIHNVLFFQKMDCGKGDENHQKEFMVKRSKMEYECKLCYKVLKSSKNFKMHFRAIHDLKPFTCDFCDNSFPNSWELDNHVKFVHAGRYQCECNLCNKKFNSQLTLTRHKNNVHERKNQFKCDSCEKSFSSRSGFGNHMITTHSDSTVKCELCDKTFGNKHYLRIHKKKHGKRNEFKCDLCLKTLSTMGHLKRHKEYKHSENRPFKCTKCSKSYKSNEDLVIHQNIHNGIRYKCEQCDNSYTNKPNLHRHVKDIHQI